MSLFIENNYSSMTIAEFAHAARQCLSALNSGKKDGYVATKDDLPVAVVLSVITYEAMMDELEDLRMQAIAAERLVRFDPKKAISHADMVARYTHQEGNDQRGQLALVSADDDRQELSRMFESAVKAVYPELQALITEHADINYTWCQGAICKRWMGGLTFVPDAPLSQ